MTVSDAADASARQGGTGRTTPGASCVDPPDVELVHRMTAGDQSSMAALYDRHGRRTYSLARRICADDGIAQDVVHEVFLALWRDPGRFDADRGSFGSWLLTRVHHQAVDAVRRESAVLRRTAPPSVGAQEWLAGPAAGADIAVVGAVHANHVQGALSRLPQEELQALVLAYYRGHTQREVAAITGVPLGTVKSRMFTGLQRLRGLLAFLMAEPAAEQPGPSR